MQGVQSDQVRRCGSRPDGVRVVQRAGLDDTRRGGVEHATGVQVVVVRPGRGSKGGEELAARVEGLVETLHNGWRWSSPPGLEIVYVGLAEGDLRGKLTNG